MAVPGVSTESALTALTALTGVVCAACLCTHFIAELRIVSGHNARRYGMVFTT